MLLINKQISEMNLVLASKIKTKDERLNPRAAIFQGFFLLPQIRGFFAITEITLPQKNSLIFSVSIYNQALVINCVVLLRFYFRSKA